MTETPYGLYGRQNPKIPTSLSWVPVLIPRTVAIEAVWPALQLNLSLCPILFLSPPFHRFWATGNALVCFLENTTYITEVNHQNSLIFKALGWASSNPIILGFLRPYYFLLLANKWQILSHLPQCGNFPLDGFLFFSPMAFFPGLISYLERTQYHGVIDIVMPWILHSWGESWGFLKKKSLQVRGSKTWTLP